MQVEEGASLGRLEVTAENASKTGIYEVSGVGWAYESWG
jgi:hypothetical protein